MKNKRILFLLVFCIIISACGGMNTNINYDDSLTSPPIFESLVISDAGSIVYYGLTPGISTVDDVVITMNETGLMKQDVEENPFIGHNGSGQIVYSYGLVPEAKHYVEFTFTNEHYLDLMNIVVSDTHVGEFIDSYGEPSSILFSVSKRFNKKSCGMMMLYDEPHITAHFGMGLVFEKCGLSQNTTIGNIHLYSDTAYSKYKNDFLSTQNVSGTLDDYLYPWKGYGDMLELYPDYLLVKEE